MRWLASLLFCLLMAPHVASAAVRINEVAWMGTEESYLCNWIELYNQSDQPVDVSQWTLEIDDIVRNLADGEGEAAVVPARGFLLLERVTNTCPDPVPNVSGWYLTLGNLPNQGATLTLRRSDESMTDRVVGGEDWQNIGGDNDTKDTAQRTSAGWVTAAATPGTANHAMATADTETATTKAEATAASNDAVRLYDPDSSASNRSLGDNDHELSLAITAPDTTYVGQPIDLTVAPSGVGRGVARSLHYQWNFGDLHTTTTQEPAHAYEFPGTYVVTVRGTYGSYEALARHEVTVLPVRLTVGRDRQDNIQIHNTAPYEIDLSRYTIKGTKDITLPARTILLPEQTLTLERSALEDGVSGLVSVLNRRGEVVANNLEQVRTEYLAADVVGQAEARPQVAGAGTAAVSQPLSVPASADDELEQAPAATATARFVTEPPVPAATDAESFEFSQDWRDYWPYAALVALIGVTIGFLFWPARRESGSAADADWFV